MQPDTINKETVNLEQLLTNSSRHLSQTINTFSEDNFNIVPFEESWTAAQVAEHVIKSLELIDQLVHASTQPTERDPEQHVVALRALMEDFSVKAKSAPDLLPRNEPMTRAAIQNRLLQSMEKMTQSIHSLDLSETCITSEFPGFGYVTRLELISFATFHTDRHNHQMKNIRNVLVNAEQ